MSRSENELLELRYSLEKALIGNQHEQEILDILLVLRKKPISVDLLKKTNIGQVLKGTNVVRKWLLFLFHIL